MGPKKVSVYRVHYTHGLNAKIGFEKYASDPEIFVKMCKNLKVWFGESNFDTFCAISRDPMHIFKTDFCVETVTSSPSF